MSTRKAHQQTTGGRLSRRLFLRSGGLAAAATGAAAAGLIGAGSAPLSVFAQSKFQDAYGGLVKTFDSWIAEAGDSRSQAVRLFALGSFYDDYCGTYPKWPFPPFPPRFDKFKRELDGIEQVLKAADEWIAGVGEQFLPGGLLVSVLADDIDFSCGTRVPGWPRPRGFEVLIGL